MKSAHTPGPWSVKRPTFGGGVFVAPTEANSVRLSIAKVTHENAETEIANARLIAEAPAMLKALRDVVRETGFDNANLNAMSRARAIIARIDGAS